MRKSVACCCMQTSVCGLCCVGWSQLFFSLTTLLGPSPTRDKDEIMKMDKISSHSIHKFQGYSSGRLTGVLCFLLVGLLFLLRGTPFGGPCRDYQPEYVTIPHLKPTLDTPQSNHRTEVVQWDQNSLIIHGQRVILWCVSECIPSAQVPVTLAPGLERYIRGGCPFPLFGGIS